MAILKTANFSGSNGSHFSIRLDYSLTQNKTANTSTIKYSLYFITDKYGSGYGSAVTGYINGASVGSCTSIGTNSTILIGTKEEKDIKHNSDGTKSVSYSASMSGPWTGLGSASLSGTLTLPKIDRFATLDENSLPTSITDESSIKFSYSNPAGFKVKPVITITQDSLISIEGDYITSSPCTWNWLTTDANKKLVYDCVRSKPEATARLKLNTYDSSGNFIGSTMSAATIPFTLVNCSPTIAITCAEQNSKVKSIVGSNLILLNNASSLKVDASLTTKKNATVLEVLIQDKKVSSPYSTTFTVSGAAGNYKVNASVKDSRQITVPATSSTYQLVDYRPVSIDSYNFKRENPTSNKIKLNAEITYWGITLNGTANAPTISYSTDGSTYTTIPSSAYSINNTNHKITISNYEVPTTLDYKKQGTYYLRVVDKFTEDKENQIVTKGIAIFERGEHDVQVNGDLFLADESRQNKTPLNVSGDVSKNLFNKNTAPSLKGYSSSNAIISGSTGRFTYIPCKPNTTYTIQKMESIRFIVSCSENVPAVGVAVTRLINAHPQTTTTVTTNSTAKYLILDYYDSDADEQSIRDSIQIELGSTGTSYEEYFEPTLSIRTSNGTFREVEINEDNYSTTEQRIGTWIDGKPLYRKVFRTTFPTVSTNGTYVANKEVLFADNVDFSFLVTIFIENGNQRQNLPYINNSGYVSKGFVQSGLLMLTGNSTGHSGMRTTAIILYTKTTD